MVRSSYRGRYRPWGGPMRRFLPVLLLGALTLALAQENPDDSSGTSGTTVVSGFEDDCRACHDSGVPDRHHRLYGQLIGQDSAVPYPDANGDGAPEITYGCLNCHDPSLSVERDCVACHASPAGTVPDGTALAEGPLTVFAPTDDAFAKLPAGTVESLLQPENQQKLVSILKGAHTNCL